MNPQSSNHSSGPRSSRQRGNPFSGRSRNRGGIQKRNATPTRIDKDGDAVMDSASVRGGRGTSVRGSAQNRRHGTPDTLQARVSGRLNKIGIDPTSIEKAVLRGVSSKDPSRDSKFSARLPRNDGLDTLRVWGLKESRAISNPDGGLKDLLAFLERKATHPDSPAVKIKKSRVEGDAVIVSVQPDDYNKVLRLNGFTFAQSVLKIEPNAESVTTSSKKDDNESSQTIDILKNLLARRYHIDTKLLDLSGLGSDPDLVKMGMFNSTSRESKFFPALMKICDKNFATAREKEDAVISVSLANNALNDVQSVTTLAQTFPSIKNLDLSGNSIKDLAGLSAWRWKFRRLEHIVLTGNPIESNEPQYKSDVAKWYPTVLLLNNMQVRTTEEATAASKDHLPLPILGPSFNDEASIAENFIKQFFPAFDSDRIGLVRNFYDDKSTFSLSINTSAPREESQPTASWDQYLKRSRNLTRLTHTTAQMSRLYSGAESIGGVFPTIPATRHPELLSEPHKWCIECHTIPGLPDPTGQSASGVGGLLVIVHGEFSEIDVSTNQTKSIRSFDRTFLLGPGTGLSGIRIVSDILTLRAYGGFKAWEAQDTPIANRATAQPVQDLATQIMIPENFGVATPEKTEEQVQKEVLAVQLSKATGMTFEYSGMCLEQSAWNLEEAAIAFEQAKGNLPPEAFAKVLNKL